MGVAALDLPFAPSGSQPPHVLTASIVLRDVHIVLTSHVLSGCRQASRSEHNWQGHKDRNVSIFSFLFSSSDTFALVLIQVRERRRFTVAVYEGFLVGIDYTHPALGGGFGPGFKVVGGYDLVGDDYTGVS